MTNGSIKQCEVCGCEIIAKGRRKYCLECAEQVAVANRVRCKAEIKSRKKAEERAEQRKSLSEKAAHAKELGISYGQLQKMKILSQIERVQI